jgi:hypothetical protein
MRKLILLLCAFSLLAEGQCATSAMALLGAGCAASGGGGGSISLIKITTCGNPQPSGLACTITATSPGSSLVVAMLLENPLNTIGSVTDSASDVFQQVPSCTGSTAGAGAYDSWWLPVVTAGTTSITVVTIGGSGVYLTIYEVNALTTVSPACQVLNTQGPSTTPAGPSVTTSVQPSFVVGALSPTGNCTGGTGAFTNDTTLGGYCTSHLITTGTGGQQPAWTSTSSVYGAFTASFYH